MSLTSSREYIEGEGTPSYTGPYTCSDAWTGPLTLTVANGSITGSLALTENGTVNCDFPFTPEPQYTNVSMTVSGTASPSALTLIFGPATPGSGEPQGNLAGLPTLFATDVCSPTGEPGPPLTVPLVSPTSAAGTPQIQYTMGSDCAGSAGDTLSLSTNITLKGSCDPTAYATASREFDTAQSFYSAGIKELGAAADGITSFRDEYIKESLDIGAEKLTALDVLRSLSENLFEAAEVTGLYVGIGVTIEEFALKVIPLAQDTSRLTDEAHADFERGDMWAAQAMADLQTALAQGPCTDSADEARLNQMLADQKLDDDAHNLIAGWEHNDNETRYLSPITNDTVDADAALAQAKAQLKGTQSNARRAAAAVASIKPDAAQVRAAIGYLEKALGYEPSVRADLSHVTATDANALSAFKALFG
ncbi:MAG: hypothetical protein ABSD82_00375 [Solirubrobacteraceae bacterium]